MGWQAYMKRQRTMRSSRAQVEMTGEELLEERRKMVEWNSSVGEERRGTGVRAGEAGAVGRTLTGTWRHDWRMEREVLRRGQREQVWPWRGG